MFPAFPRRRLHACLILLLSAGPVYSQPDSPSIVSGEAVLYTPSGISQFSVTKGATANYDAASRLLKVAIAEEDSAVTFRPVRLPSRPDPVEWLGDLAPAVEIEFRATGEKAPDAFQVFIDVFDSSVKPMIKKAPVQTAEVPVSSAKELSDGWKSIRLPLGKITAATPGDVILVTDTIERGRIQCSSAGAFEVRKVSLVRLRDISVATSNAPSENLESLEIFGHTKAPDAEVLVELADGRGKVGKKIARAVDGVFRLTWGKPPLVSGASGELRASIVGETALSSRAIAKPVFGYPTETEHLWLSVKGRDIVTSEKSKEGSVPFLAAGAGYGKDVLVRGHDDDIASYCKSMYLNTIRLAFYNTYFNSRPDTPLDFQDIVEFVDPVLDAAKKHDLYIILDEHSYFKNEIDEETARGEQKSAGWTEERFNTWVDRWVQVAERYKDEPRVLAYELCNEPVCSPETARKWYRKCIEAIRKVDQRHIIMVGTHNWSHSRSLEATWEGVADKIDAPFNQVVFSFHDYPLDDDPWKVQGHLREFQKKYSVPVMCTEFGSGGRPEITHREFQSGMLAMFGADRVGWMIWSIYQDKERAASYPTPVRRNLDKSWTVTGDKPRYWIPFVELWAPAARMTASPIPSPR